jgi:tetratricopeptide (TPR) repeat protein
MLDAAIGQLNLCLGLKPSHPFYLLRMGILLEAKGDLEEALSVLEAAVEIKPDLQQAKDGLKRMKDRRNNDRKVRTKSRTTGK